MTEFAFKPAKREALHLLIGVAGGTGSGKTMSALRLARGLAGADPFALIDTESRRALQYGDHFQPWKHGELDPPFRPDSYLAAIKAAEKDGYPVIVVDSTSHEHAGVGGLLDWHEEEIDRMTKGDASKREAMNFGAWKRPKESHKRFVNELLKLKAHLILCFRAEEKIEVVKDGNKTKYVPKKTLTGLDGWIPISEKSLPYELTLSLLFTADKPGIPKPIKLLEDLKPFVPLDQHVSEETGQRLAEWARGGALSEGGGENVYPGNRVSTEGSTTRVANQSPEQPPSENALTAEQFKAKLRGLVNGVERVKTAGASLFPGRSADTLSDEERGQLWATLSEGASSGAGAPSESAEPEQEAFPIPATARSEP